MIAPNYELMAVLLGVSAVVVLAATQFVTSMFQVLRDDAENNVSQLTSIVLTTMYWLLRVITFGTLVAGGRYFIFLHPPTHNAWLPLCCAVVYSAICVCSMFDTMYLVLWPAISTRILKKGLTFVASVKLFSCVVHGCMLFAVAVAGIMFLLHVFLHL